MSNLISLKNAVSGALTRLGNRRLRGEVLRLRPEWYEIAEEAIIEEQGTAPILAFLGLNLEQGDENIVVTSGMFGSQSEFLEFSE